MTSRIHDAAFAKMISEDHIDVIKISDTALDAAIEYIQKNFSPDDIFPDSELGEWALKNGFVEKE